MIINEYVETLVGRKIISAHQFDRVENWASHGVVLVLKRLTDPQSYEVMEALSCDLIHCESLGDSIKINNYYFGNFRKS